MIAVNIFSRCVSFANVFLSTQARMEEISSSLSTMLSGLNESTGLKYDIRFSIAIVLLILIIIVNLILNKVKKEGFGYFAFYDLKSSRVYTKEFNQVAKILWDGLTVNWTGNVYLRTELTPVKHTDLSEKAD